MSGGGSRAGRAAALLAVVGLSAGAVLARRACAADAAAVTARARDELAGPWTFRRVTAAGAPAEAWLPARVPGCVHTDLQAAGKIGDPFYRLNEKDQQWIERESWDYRTTLRATPELLARQRVELVFAGLDTYAEVFINGVSVLWADNMFRTWRVDVKARLVAGDNTLVVRFRSPIVQVKPAYDRLGYRLPAVNDQATEMVSMFTRKAPYHYGWDWGPRFVTAGIWRPAAVESWDDARLEDVQVHQQQIDAAAAQVTVKARVVAAAAGRARVTVALAGGALLAQADVALVPGRNDVTLPARIERPQLWWPNGLGPQALTTLETRLLAPGGGVRDERRTRIGLRSLRVEHARDGAGKTFTVRVNGAPVFMKGANWIPADSFVPRVTPDRYRALLRAAADANMNMLRVWGGGIYEDDLFYELCDELGLLVFQDFMFACSMYPGDAAFMENVRQEAVDNVRRLRNHPSLALWAGNNEVEAAWKNWGWQTKFHLSKKVQEKLFADYKALFHQLLPAVVAEEDPGRFYTRSSPSANEDTVPANKLGWGDMHYWGVWHAEHPYTSYSDNISRFMSEYGFQSFPELATVARYTAGPADWDIGGPVMLSHQRHPRGNALIRTYMERDFRKPKDFASFLYVGQLLQGTVIKYAAEAHRRRMGYNWGSLYWQLDDCWPVASWAGIDYFGRWKALHHLARHFFAPVLVSPVEEKGTVAVWGISDRRFSLPARLTVRLLELGGRELWRKEQEVTLPANASRSLLALPRQQALAGADPTRVVLVAELTDKAGRRLSRNLLFFEKTRELQLPPPGLTLEVVEASGGNPLPAVKVTARQLARGVYLSAGDAAFEDNYFDLLPGESVVVPLRAGPTSPPDGKSLKAALRAMTVAESY